MTGQLGCRTTVTGLLFSGLDRKGNVMNRYLTVGLAVVAGAALFEAALIPGLVIGGAAVLAPKLLPTRRLRPALNGATRRRAPAKAATAVAAASTDQETADAPWTILPKFAFGQAIAKTITYRVIVTGLDFTVNFVVIGELGTAAGLSTFNMIAGPLSYLGHEAVWNYLGPTEGAIALGTLAGQRADSNIAQDGGWQNYKISRTLAKTVTFRTLATLMDFTVNYVVVRDVTQAVILSSSGFILGPFVYYGHEWVWDRFTKPQQPAADAPAPIKLLPAPARA
jgi:uncharacterized membrane protein